MPRNETFFWKICFPNKKTGPVVDAQNPGMAALLAAFEAVFGGESQIYFPWNPGRTGPGSTPGASIAWPKTPSFN